MKKALAFLLLLLLLPVWVPASGEQEIPILSGDACLGCEEEGFIFDAPSAASFDYVPALRTLRSCVTGCPEYTIRNIACPGGEKGVRFLLVRAILPNGGTVPPFGFSAGEEALPNEGTVPPFGSRVYVKDGYINIALAAEGLDEETVNQALIEAWKMQQ